MKFLIDAQLPRRFAVWMTEAGHDALHTLDMPLKNRTPDKDVVARAMAYWHPIRHACRRHGNGAATGDRAIAGGSHYGRCTVAPCCSHYLWAMLLAHIYETLPLVCPLCQSQMRIIAFITEVGSVREILDHLGESTLPPKVAPAREPPLWELELAHRHQVGNDPQWNPAPQPEPVFEFDQRVAW